MFIFKTLEKGETLYECNGTVRNIGPKDKKHYCKSERHIDLKKKRKKNTAHAE